MTRSRDLPILLAVLIGLVLAMPRPAGAQEIGIVQSDILVLDPERLFEQSRLGQSMLADHQARRDALAERNSKLKAELEAEEQRLTELRPETAPDDFAEMADAFDDKVRRLRQDSERRVNDIERERERLPLDFLRRVEPVLSEVMQDAGAVVVLDGRKVLFRADVVDITDAAIARINAQIGDGGNGGDAGSSVDRDTSQ